MPTKPLVAHGLAVGLDTLTGLLFDPHKPYVGCRLCGRVYQSIADRDPVGVYEKNPASFDYNPNHVTIFAMEKRKGWSITHAKQHSEQEHLSLAMSGRWCTPEAALQLVAYGVISLIDLAIDDEVSSALRESKPVPKDDSED